MSLQADSLNALKILERIQDKLRDSNDLSQEEDLSNLIYMLESPLFSQILNLQDSIAQLKQVQTKHIIHSEDFDFDATSGELILADDLEPYEPVRVEPRPLEGEGRELVVDGPEIDADAKEVSHVLATSRFAASPSFVRGIEAVAQSRHLEVITLEKQENTSLGFSVVGLKSEHRGELGIFVQKIQPGGLAHRDGRLQENDHILAIDGQVLEASISHQQAIQLLQRASGRVELVLARGQTSVAAAASSTTPTAATRQSQQHSPASAASSSSETTTTANPAVAAVVAPGASPLDRTPSAVSDSSDMVLSTEWIQLEVIDLLNDGSGLGFGIIGGKSTGVVVKTILPGGVADRDGRLRSGDHLLQIGDVTVRGMGSEQVATVLRQSGAHVRLIIARCIEEPTEDVPPHAPIIPTHQLDEHLLQINEMLQAMAAAHGAHPYSPYMMGDGGSNMDLHQELPADYMAQIHQEHLEAHGDLPQGASLGPPMATEEDVFDVELVKDVQGLGITIAGYVGDKTADELSGIFVRSIAEGSTAALDGRIQLNDQIIAVDSQPLEGFTNQQAVDVLRNTGQLVRLKLARYKHGPKYDKLQHYIIHSSPQVFELSPLDFHHLLGRPSSPAAAASSPSPSPLSPSHQGHRPPTQQPFNAPLPSEESETVSQPVTWHLPQPSQQQQQQQQYPQIMLKDMLLTRYSPEHGQPEESQSPFGAEGPSETPLTEPNTSTLLYSGELTPQIEDGLIAQWENAVGEDHEIIVAQLSKFKEGGGLGISLEGTVDVENGVEKRPHHYIRSVLEDGPVGLNGKLQGGDELLEVNGIRLLGLNHTDVVKVLKELPQHVRIVCARPKPAQTLATSSSASASATALADDNVYAQSSPNNQFFQSSEVNTNAPYGGQMSPTTERLIKAKSEQDLPASSNLGGPASHAALSRLKSRSLEPLAGFAMWSSEPTVIELMKGERGLGFSILDYQDPINPNETVIVIRSLVPGGVAQVDGRLVPGDRLIFVNDVNLENATLDQAVQALKGASRGMVLIGVFKPLPLPEIGESSTDDFDFDMFPTEAPPAPPNQPPPDLDFHQPYHATETQSLLRQSESPPLYVPPTNPVSSLMTTPPQSDLKSVSSSPSSTASPVITSPPRSMSPVPSPTQSPRSPTVPHVGYGASGVLPTSLERTIRIKKGTDQLGLTVESVDQGQNGCVVKSLSVTGAVAKDGRISLGDYLVSVNNEPMRKITNSQARVILRRAQLLGTDISVTYISAQDFKDSSVASFKAHGPALSTASQGQLSTNLSFGESVAVIHEAVDQTEVGVHSDAERLPDTLDDLKESRMEVGGVDMWALYRSPSSPPGYTEAVMKSSSSQGSSPSAVHRQMPPPSASNVSVSPSSSPVVSRTTSPHITSLEESISLTSSRSVDSSWGPPRTVNIHRQPGENLGINIIGGRVDLFHVSPESQKAISGIFIKHVSDSSPAGRDRLLKKGDRILSVDDTDLRDATHDQAVAAIKQSTTPVKFVIQSLVEPRWMSQDSDSALTLDLKDVTREDDVAEEDTSIKSQPLKMWPQGSQTEIPRDVDFQDETEDEYGYTMQTILKRYGDLGGQLHMVEVERQGGNNGLGLSLAGNRDLSVMSVYVVGIQPESPAASDGRIHVGDELLEINGQKLHGRCHLNASAIIKSVTSPTVKIVLLRREDYMKHMAIRPLRLPPVDQKDDPNTLIPKKVARLQKDNTLSLDQDELADTPSPPSVSFSSSEAPSSTPTPTAQTPSNHVVVSPHPPASSIDYSKFSNVTTVTLEKGSHGLGFAIQEGIDDKKDGIYVKAITPGGAASQEGQLSLGDRILAVQDLAVVDASYNQAIETLRKVKRGSVSLTFSKPSQSSSAASTKKTASNTTPAPAPTAVRLSPVPSEQLANGTQTSTDSGGGVPRSHKQEPVRPTTHAARPVSPANVPAIEVTKSENPLTCPILPGKETVIEIEKGKTGLGLSIIGGADTLLGTIIVHEVYEEGAAAKDNRLWAGDQLLEVNNIDLRNASHERAISILRQTPSTVRMVVFRDELLLKDEEFYEIFSVELLKKPGKGLGLTIVGRKRDPGIFISEIVKGGVADTDGRLVQGDQILSVNGEDLRTASQEAAATLLKTLMGKVVLSVGRLKAGSSASSRRSSNQSGHSNIKKSDSSASNRSKGRRSKSIPSSKSY